MSRLSTIPPEDQQGSLETLDWTVDFAAYLAASETITGVTATLTEVEKGLAYPAGIQAGSPTFLGKLVTVWLTALRKGVDYRLVVTITTNQSRVEETETTIRCVV